MTQEPKVDHNVEYKSRGYEIEVRNVATGMVVEILLEPRAERWVVKTDWFYGSYKELDSAIAQALKLMKKKLNS